MKSTRTRIRTRSWLLRAASAAIGLGCVAILHAQYPGHIDTERKPRTATLRSVAVLEWTGDRARPNATRLVPVSLFDGEHLQDGGLYLARPVPLALDSGTEYEVEGSGRPQGWFDIGGAREIGTDWFGFGDWKPYLPPPPKKLHPSRYPPTVVRDKSDEDKPHFVRRDQSSGSGNTSNTGSTGSASSDKTSDKTQASSAPVDPDRPTLRRRPDEDKPQQQAAAAPESPSKAPDPDRPRLSHGKPADLQNEPKPLEITPVAMGQTVAVSDAGSVGTQSFAYEWGSSADAGAAQKELEAQAVTLLAAAAATPTSASTSVAPAAKKTTAATRHSTSRKAAPRKKAKPVESASPLADVHFSAFALTYGSGATLVMTAREAATTRSIAVIALQDIYGKIQVLWHSVTDDTHLDVTPRMKLIDAVDPRGDGRANLLFEQRNDTDRRFALYAVGATTAEQVFATDPLPLHPVAQQND
ncbi:MAG: hypothetical protein QOK38_3984 [Acidobacteriaceae bacterium]|jgi:hypothetical protein|nr:hypothetical protein [Acidobacteriaceae bacterium]